MSEAADTRRPLLRVDPWLIGPQVRGGLTTRVGFPSAGVGPDEDDQARRAASRARLATALGVDPARMAWLKQVHGADVLGVERPGYQGEADALVSTDPSHVLLVSVADCGPVLLWDTAGPAFAVAHAGWRGVVRGVVERTVDALADLGATPSTLRAWVGPCIGPAHFEVGPEVAEQFAPEFVLAPDGSGRRRPHVDLPAAITARLRARGLSDDAVRASGDCTYELEDRYWSYRRDGGICGRQLGYLTRCDGGGR